MNVHRPDFLIIGAMKSATSTLHEQLARQPGIFMSRPKEPDFFSDDDVYARGIAWYESLFAAAPEGSLRGESSTHYTKLPTYPQTLARMLRHVPDAKLIYVMRHPVDRLISHYIHEWTQAVISGSLDQAVERHPELIQYGLYAYQLRPFLESYGRDRVLPVFFDRLRARPREELERVCRFLGYEGAPTWDEGLGAQNVSAERLRKCGWRDALVEAPLLRALRRALVPRGVRAWVKRFWTMQERPELGPASLARVRAAFDADLAQLGAWLGVELSCETFKATTAAGPLEWTSAPAGRGAVAEAAGGRVP